MAIARYTEGCHIADEANLSSFAAEGRTET